MALNKQPVSLNFAQGLDTKTDPKQVQAGKMLALQNGIFDTGGELKKRNGYGILPSLPDNSNTYLTTFAGDLTAIGNTLNSFSSGAQKWNNKGPLQPVSLSTLPLIRNSSNQSSVDSVTSPGGLTCAVYGETTPAGATVYKYVVSDVDTGNNVVAPTLIPASAGTISSPSQVFVLTNYFIILSINSTGQLQYTAISLADPTITRAPLALGFSVTTFDGVAAFGSLYIAFSSGTTVSALSINPLLITSTAVNFTAPATVVNTSITADDTTMSQQALYVSFYSDTTISAFAVSPTFGTIFGVTTLASGVTGVVNLTSAAQNGLNTVIYEISNTYIYDVSIRTDFLKAVTVSSSAVVGLPYFLIRSVGLASQAFIIAGIIYVLTAYQSIYQSSYFLINVSASTETIPVITAKLAYSNGGGYLTKGLPSVTVSGNSASVPYLIQESIAAVNKNTIVPPPVNTAAGIYAQLGINLATFVFSTDGLVTAEIGNNLNLSGGYLSMYDGYSIVENNFFLWPDSIEATASIDSGTMTAGQYFYQVTYEWQDNQGNLFRSAPSIPITIALTTENTVTLDVPTLRLTAKTANPVKIVIYRWSQAQQVYYQVTSVIAPLLNDLTVDYVTFYDKTPDPLILGNAILYTTGGVVEDINGPASNILTLFDTRLWLVEAEDPNLLWYSKQVIESTPVEMSDLFTIYVAPTISETTSSGPITALGVMDDKLIIFKKNSIFYINGAGPDNTGSNSQYGPPIFITAAVGCVNTKSIVLMQQGLMFQSDKGIWLLGRDLSTQYIGAAVEQFNSALVQSATTIPTTNQVRFALDNGITLMYDYYYAQWGTFVGIPCASSAIYKNLHTFINKYGSVYQETVGQYLDGSNPVTMSFQTAWFNIAGLQGYERAYYFYLLGVYASPHKLNVQISYDYSPSPEQSILISPTNFSPTWGSLSTWGADSGWGGSPALEQWRVFLQRQRCQAFSLSISEVFDSTLGVVAGAGLSLSGLNLIVGVKKGYKPISNAHSAG